MRTLHFTQITDDRFNENIKDLLEERIDAIHKQFEGIDGIVVANPPMYKVDFGDSLQYRADFYIQKNTRELTWDDVYHKINQIKAVPYEFVDRAKLEQTFKTPEAIAKKFIKDGWDKDTSFVELSPELAEKIGGTSIISDMAKGHKYFIMNGSDNIFNEKGEVAMYNVGGDITKHRAELHGLSLMDNITLDTKNGLAVGYLEPSEQLIARASFELSKNVSEETFKEFMDGMMNGTENLEFYAQYDNKENKMQLLATTVFKYNKAPAELSIPMSEHEEDLLYRSLDTLSEKINDLSLYEMFEESKEGPYSETSYEWEDPREATHEPTERSAKALYDDETLLAEYVNDHIDEVVITNKSDEDIVLVFDESLELEPIYINANSEYALIENEPDFLTLEEALSRNMFYIEDPELEYDEPSYDEDER